MQAIVEQKQNRQKMEKHISEQMSDITYDQDQKRVQFALVQSNEQRITLPKTHVHIMMTQLNVKDGLKAFGNKGDEAILKEIKQLNTQQALKPCSRNKISQEERKAGTQAPNVPQGKKRWDNKSKKLCGRQATLLYFSKCTRQDIQRAVAFLCTRVKELDTDN